MEKTWQRPENIPAVDAELEAMGAGCATLTPLIKQHIRDLESGQVLHVISDDPAAPEGVAAWARLTGHRLLAMIGEDDTYRFYIGKK